MKELKYHKDFILNGKSFDSTTDLITYTKNKYQDIFWFLTDWFDDLDFVIASTSGSHGKAKSVKIKKEFMINSALATGKYFDLDSKTKALLCLSTNFIAGKMMLVRALVLGWHLDIVATKLNPLEKLAKNYDFSAMVPLQLHHSIDKINHIKKLIVGGGLVSKSMITEIKNVKTHIYATFGMTETVSHIAVKKLNHIEVDVNKNYFTVLPNVEILTDLNGCLVIDAPKISDQVIVTRDLVKIYSDTEFEWLGRLDNIVNSGGVKILPEQVEKKIQEFIFNRFFISSRPDDVLGEKLILLIEKDSDGSEEKRFYIDLISKLKNLHKYEIPKEIFLIDKFQETKTKKIQRRKTLDLLFD
jgi:O-succinylbenzoic acid--CoA ligase